MIDELSENEVLGWISPNINASLDLNLMTYTSKSYHSVYLNLITQGSFCSPNSERQDSVLKIYGIKLDIGGTSSKIGLQLGFSTYFLYLDDTFGVHIGLNKANYSFYSKLSHSISKSNYSYKLSDTIYEIEVGLNLAFFSIVITSPLKSIIVNEYHKEFIFTDGVLRPTNTGQYSFKPFYLGLHLKLPIFLR